jgi:hypothetical protein
MAVTNSATRFTPDNYLQTVAPHTVAPHFGSALFQAVALLLWRLCGILIQLKHLGKDFVQ